MKRTIIVIGRLANLEISKGIYIMIEFITDQYPEQFREFKSSWISAASKGAQADVTWATWDIFYLYIFGA